MPEKRKVNKPGAAPGVSSMVAMDKSNDLQKAYSDFFDYLGRYKLLLGVAIIFSIIGAIFNLIGPGKFSEITNLITEGLSGIIALDKITDIAILLVVLYVLGFVLNYIQGFIMATITQNVTKNMRHDIESKINRLPLKYFDSVPIGDVLSRVTNDVDTIGQMMNQSFSTLVSSAALLLGSLIMMFSTNAMMATSGVLATLLGIFLMFLVIGKSQVHFKGQQEELGIIDGQIEEIYGGHTVVKLYNAVADAREKFHDSNERLFNSAWKAQFLSGIMMPLMIFIGNLAYVVVCIVGAILAAKGSISFGVIVAFMLYIRLFTQPLQNLSQAATSVQSMAAACERVFDFLSEEEIGDESDKKEFLQTVKGDVTFSHVRFGYEEEQTIIKDFSAQIKAGQKVAIVGPTGAGKTTMVNLLMRFYEINSGKIQIDGMDIGNLTRDNIHNLFGMVLQDTWLFEGTIRENICYGKKNISDERLDEICEAVGLLDMIHQEPEGYDTVLDDKASLSIGQKQLITIARAMVEDAPLMILDEATSSVDTRTELKVQKAMDLLTNGRTSFVIAHRLSTIRNADLILVMKDGDVIESGNHEELLKRKGFYAALYNSQFEEASTNM